MNKSHYNALFKVFLNDITITRDAGQEEYAHTKSNVFANFERVANGLDITREKVLMTYLLKHIDGINAYIKGHKSQRESVKGRITDAIVYLFLLWAMVEENESCTTIPIKKKEKI